MVQKYILFFFKKGNFKNVQYIDCDIDNTPIFTY